VGLLLAALACSDGPTGLAQLLAPGRRAEVGMQQPMLRHDRPRFGLIELPEQAE
jgi:hypothetical protein